MSLPQDIEMQAGRPSPGSPRLGTSRTLVEDSEGQRQPNFSFSDEVWPDVNLGTARGYLAYAKLKDSDWGQANYRLHGAFHALHLNHLNTEILEMTQEIMQLSAEADRPDPKDVPEGLNKKINQLMEASRAKLLAYDELIISHRTVKSFEEPSKRHLMYQQQFEAYRVLSPGILGDFSNNPPADEFRSLSRRDPWLTWGDAVGQAGHKLANIFTRGSDQAAEESEICDDISVTQISRRKLNPYVFVLLSLTLVLLFVAPMPIVLFKVLSVPSTLVLLTIFEIMFTAFFVKNFHLNFETLLIVSIAYGGLMWSSASNWISIE